MADGSGIRRYSEVYAIQTHVVPGALFSTAVDWEPGSVSLEVPVVESISTDSSDVRNLRMRGPWSQGFQDCVHVQADRGLV